MSNYAQNYQNFNREQFTNGGFTETF